MAEKAMYDYLSDKTADNNETLSVAPQNVMSEVGQLNQKIHEFDDGSVEVVEISSNNYFNVTLQWTISSESDAGTIMDFWHNSGKGNGRAETFYWDHPTDGHTYVVRFLEKLTRVRKAGLPNYLEVSQVKLRVEGRKVE